MNKGHCYLIVLIAMVLGSCQKKELPVKPHDPGNVTTATVDMGQPYKYQVYYSLKNNTAVGQNVKTTWDVAMEPSAAGYRVVLNSSKSMFALNTGKTAFAAVSIADTVGFSVSRKWDEASGNMDSTAIGDWRDTKMVYILDRGYDENGVSSGMQKMQLLSVTDTGYTLRFAAMDGTGDTTIEVKKDTAYNLAFVSFTTKGQVTVEPPKATWDISFSQYTYIFYDMDPPIPYLVTGCLLNRNKTMAIMDTARTFDQINYSTTTSYNMAADISTIGYAWKTYGGTGYVVNTKYNYVIRSGEGVYYKLHFTGFYNSTGKQGHPKWEYQPL